MAHKTVRLYGLVRPTKREVVEAPLLHHNRSLISMQPPALRTDFDPNDLGIANGNYFALPFSIEEAALVLLPVAWEVTTSYGGGSVDAPQAILDASLQVDLYDPANPQGWRRGIATIPQEEAWHTRSVALRAVAQRIIEQLEAGLSTEDDSLQHAYQEILAASEALNAYTYEQCKVQLAAGKKVGLIGGDHSTPLGAIRAYTEHYPELGILHLDAHADLRIAYEGFAYSHASIMYNVLQQLPALKSLVQVGLRDYCDGEVELASSEPRIVQYTEHALNQRRYTGESWAACCERILAQLPQQVYISFDIDALDPSLCPSTGTPVPGGLSFGEACYLLEAIPASGREIVGFDLTEVAPNPTSEWDANVGARILYKLCNMALKEPQPSNQ